MDDYSLYCNDIECLVIEFYVVGSDPNTKNCPGCGNPGHEEAY